jgi:hypothetical protein
MADENENLDSTNETGSEETVETPAVETEVETIETEPEVDIAQLQATNKKLYERAKKAEAELKASKATKPAQAIASPLNVEEAVLLANGMSEDLMSELKAVAQVRKVSLIKAQTDPIFVAVKDKFEKDKKREEASLPASRSSGTAKARKDFKSTGLTREEHMAMVRSQS